ncbi:MAG: copper chaperone PCu(A)C [Candidatus Limnocylindrales bacterium]
MRGSATGMRHTDGIHVPAVGTSTLEPRGFHVMLIGMTADLTAGQPVELTLGPRRSRRGQGVRRDLRGLIQPC